MQEHIESITEKLHRIYKEAGCDSRVMTVFNKFSSGRKCAVTRKKVMKAKHKFRKLNINCNKNNVAKQGKIYRNMMKKAKNRV